MGDAPLQEETMKSIKNRVLRSALVLFFSAGLTQPALSQSEEVGVTDLTGASVEAIQVEDLTQALSLQRGTRIEPTVRLPIFFEFNSVQLRPEADQLLEKISAALSSGELAPYEFSIEGHTDSVGSPGYNQGLSQDRAAAVKAFLVARGIEGDRLQTVGHGEKSPFASNETDDGRQRNRRVELINRGSAP
jgi:outer membrane protein OmpA-like peptidoglycan-associated protein